MSNRWKSPSDCVKNKQFSWRERGSGPPEARIKMLNYGTEEIR